MTCDRSLGSCGVILFWKCDSHFSRIFLWSSSLTCSNKMASLGQCLMSHSNSRPAAGWKNPRNAFPILYERKAFLDHVPSLAKFVPSSRRSFGVGLDSRAARTGIPGRYERSLTIWECPSELFTWSSTLPSVDGTTKDTGNNGSALCAWIRAWVWKEVSDGSSQELDVFNRYSLPTMWGDCNENKPSSEAR